MDPFFSARNGVFLLCLQRSGSTLLRSLLNGHREVCSPDELMVGRLIDDLTLTLRRAVGRCVPEDERDDRVRAEVRMRVDAIMEAAASLRGKTYWCEKTPENVHSADAIHDVYPDALYICQYRNCMDVVRSLLDHAGNGILFSGVADQMRTGEGTLVDAAIRHWIDQTDRLRRFEEAHPDQCIHVKYETLVFEPRETLRSLFEFLDIEWYESLLVDGLQNHEEGDRGKVLGTHSIQTDRVGIGKQIPLRRVSDASRRRMNAMLERLGYPTVDYDFNVAPSPYVPDAHRADHIEARRSERAVSAQGDRAPASIDHDNISALLQQALTDRPNADHLRGRVKVIVDDVVDGVWIVDLGTRSVEASGDASDAATGEVECTVALDASTLQAVAQGTLNTTEARIDGRIQALGDEALVTQLGQIL